MNVYYGYYLTVKIMPPIVIADSILLLSDNWVLTSKSDFVD